MNFRVDRWSGAALRSSLVAVTMAGTLLLASCGGGNGNENQSVKFSAERLIVFGDESSLLLPPSTPTAIDARKYSINGFTADTTPANSVRDCLVNPIWVQFLAFKYGLSFAECNPSNVAVTAQMRASNGAKVADVVAAIDAFVAAGGTFGKRDLITIMVGTHDILELYNSVSTASLTEAGRPVRGGASRRVAGRSVRSHHEQEQHRGAGNLRTGPRSQRIALRYRCGGRAHRTSPPAESRFGVLQQFASRQSHQQRPQHRLAQCLPAVPQHRARSGRR